MTILAKSAALALFLAASSAWADTGAFLEITLKVDNENRAAAAAVYSQYKQPFLETIDGAESKVLLVRDDDVQVLHGFDTVESAKAYLNSDLFSQDVFVALKPYFAGDPDVRIYQAH